MQANGGAVMVHIVIAVARDLVLSKSKMDGTNFATKKRPSG